MILLFVVWPAFEMLRTSFQEVGSTGAVKGWAGFENFSTLVKNPDLPNVLIRTLIWVLGVVFFTMIISLPVAQLLNAKYPGRKVVRWAVIIPWIYKSCTDLLLDSTLNCWECCLISWVEDCRWKQLDEWSQCWILSCRCSC